MNHNEFEEKYEEAETLVNRGQFVHSGKGHRLSRNFLQSCFPFKLLPFTSQTLLLFLPQVLMALRDERPDQGVPRSSSPAPTKHKTHHKTPAST
jgi:hypothetical protein